MTTNSRESKTSISLSVRPHDFAFIESLAKNDSRNPTSYVRKLLLEAVKASQNVEKAKVERPADKQITIWDDPETIDAIKSLKKSHGMPVSTVLRLLLADVSTHTQSQPQGDSK